MMRILGLAGVLVVSLATSPPMVVTATQPAAVTDDLAEIEQRLAQAWVQGDREFIESVLASDWAVIDIQGRVRTKAEVLEEMFATQDPGIEAMTIDDVMVRMVGEIGVVTGRTVATGSDGSTVRLRFTDVFVRRDGRWQVVASQGTPIQP